MKFLTISLCVTFFAACGGGVVQTADSLTSNQKDGGMLSKPSCQTAADCASVPGCVDGACVCLFQACDPLPSDCQMSADCPAGRQCALEVATQCDGCADTACVPSSACDTWSGLACASDTGTDVLPDAQGGPDAADVLEADVLEADVLEADVIKAEPPR